MTSPVRVTPASTPSTHPDPAARHYQGDSGVAYHEGKRALDPRALPWVQKLRAEKFSRWIRPDDDVFEYGVGSGWNLALLPCRRRMGCDVAEFLRPRLEALGIEFFARPEDAPSGVATVAICHQALEHTLVPTAALAELARILAPGGRLILHVPWEVEHRFARFNPNDRNHHLYHWNVQNLGNLVTTLGWRIEEIRPRRYGWDRIAAQIAVRARLGETGFRVLRRAMILCRPLREVELIARRPEP
jgi:SAM-dependent methyltransferase